MHLLVSLCNRSPKRYGALRDTLLLHVDVNSGAVRPIDLPYEVTKDAWGMTGITRYEGGYICLLQPQSLLYLSTALKPLALYPLNLVRDGHSLAYHNGLCYIASSGSDSVVTFCPERGERVFWCANHEANTDTIHLNALLWDNRGCWITAFGRREGELWRTAEHGYILNTATGEKNMADLYHPHSLTSFNGAYYVCESSAMRLRSTSGINVHIPRGYMRGLAIEDGAVFVGSTKGRTRSRSTNVLTDNGPVRQEGECGVCVYRTTDQPLDLEFSCFIDIGAFADEIYDIVVAASY